MRDAVRVLGVDTSLRSTGYGVLEGTRSRARALTWGVIRNRRDCSRTRCLAHLASGIGACLDEYLPLETAIEGVFFCRNARTSLILGEARGAVLTTCAQRDVEVFEYAPRRVKEAVVGNGSARKEQIELMIRRLTGIQEKLPSDAADALAIAWCHLASATGPEALRGKGRV
ncbi:crossover junction endodeoxyribonuclease RuvC [Kiritimatiella glycovorans]|uniref:Crossover junction endodeoxyribonuclease RuvC n=1 Tax=Kiritimatiella glycovorans TaxID=1307763 RepID=A0A0G3EI05_9BACT|nr:crossover junction endodeoxyribonuclease RuvC [Kiritimatiella glycovorans]AKJ64440.1 Crossover junction endodeoxyribonuclease RuvC [Kiritimatiella glycovorans]